MRPRRGTSWSPNIARGDTFSPGKPRLWSETPVYHTGPFPNLDLAPDGKRFVVFPLTESLADGERASLQLTFLLNFFDELRRKLP